MDFRTYLDSKIRIDFQSMNRAVFRSFRARIEKFESPRIMDVGTGTGLMIRKLLSLQLKGTAHLYGIDADAESIQRAAESLKGLLLARGYSVSGSDKTYGAIANNSKLHLTFAQADFFSLDQAPNSKNKPLHCITANAFMDLVPLRQTVQRIRYLLGEKGIFYSTINYDGLTVLLPLPENKIFEDRLLEVYHQSMDNRKTDHLSALTGGSRTGRTLYGVLEEYGFSIINFGCSDWQVISRKGKYRAQSRYFLKSIITMIYREGLKDPNIENEKLHNWFKTRLNQIEEDTLILITHQMDILAQKERV
jgi:SAM-dependent methyltransferase